MANKTNAELMAEIEELKKEKEERETEKSDNVPNKAVNNEYLNERVPFIAIKDADRYKDDISIGINGTKWVIQRGKQVMIPRYVMMAIEQSERQKAYTADVIDGYTDKYESKKNSLI